MSVDEVRAAVRNLPSADAVDVLLHLLEELLFDPGRQCLTPLPGVRLSPQEARLLHYLESARGGWRSVDQILAAISPVRAVEGDTPDPKIVDVVICRLRAKLGNQAHLLADYNGRRRLALADGVVLDWSRVE